MKAAYWIISAAVTVAGIGLMAEGHKLMNKSVKAESASGGQSVRTEHFASAKNIGVDLGSSEIRILTAKDAEEITVSVINPRDTLIIECNDDTLNVYENTEFSLFNFGGNTKRMQTTITVPEGTAFEDVLIDIGSGDVSEMSSLSMQTLDVELGSGSAVLRDLDISENCRIHTGSGDASAEQCRVGGDVWLDNGSGNFNLNGCDFREDLDIHTGSGNMKLFDTRLAKDMTMACGSGSLTGGNLEIGGRADWNFGSGNAAIDGFKPADDVIIDLGSGNVSLTLTGKQEDYGYDTMEISGSVVIGGTKLKEVEDIREGKPTITVKGGSGDVKIGFAQ